MVGFPDGALYTRAMRDNASPAHLILPLLFHKSEDGVECTARLERADALQILAFEIEADGRGGRGVALEGRSHQVLGVLRSRGDAVQCAVCQHRRAVDEVLDDGVRGSDIVRVEG
jgi:hypothetical protein